ncbi:YbcC family protein [Methylobacterium oryzisoli]|uniref:YbcC family protein n=1 Tax=Methylobacterium oryzisoli TaxID=3385502 RepID=UPI00389298FC
MIEIVHSRPTAHEAIRAAADAAGQLIPPLWPLASSVAVNPFLGHTDEPLWAAGARLGRATGAAVTMPRRWYRDRVASRAITDADLLAALDDAPADLRPADLDALKAALRSDAHPVCVLPTVASLCAEVSGIDWQGLFADRFTAWAAAQFDEGQALWAPPSGDSVLALWQNWALHDLTPEIAGLGGFARHVEQVPDGTAPALARAVSTLGLSPDALESYFHQMLLSLGGWAQYARYQLWEAELAGRSDGTLRDLLAIRVIWEEALFSRYADRIAEPWAAVAAAHTWPVRPTADLIVDAILQDAAERAAQRGLAATLAGPSLGAGASRPLLQAAFCIDVRSEVFRRALESLSPTIRTLGFAGFFGLPTAHRRFASDVEERRLPVLLRPALHTCSGGPDVGDADESARIAARARRAWGRFRQAAVSSFAFVEAAGPLYFGKLLSDALGLGGVAAPEDPAPRLEPALDLASRVATAASVLRAMSLTSNVAPVVLLVGHGATVVNNPHASALHCGACGGYSGEVNARLLAQLLNDAQVRAGLSEHGLDLPSDTVFLAALHDTTTDCVTLYDGDQPRTIRSQDLVQIRGWLAAAGEIARAERALRLPGASIGSVVARRSRDWAETRPEWGLAGCSAFIAAPRHRTAGRALHGRAFLHEYDWRQDDSFGVLELILTAPVVVASWISLQYYGSTVAPALFGSGNKLLHNVTGGIGVLEGNSGPLRAGLARQSVHDGEDFAHEPLRLSVCIEAPREAITDVLRRHAQVRALFDHRWLHLFALDQDGRLAWRYAGDLRWTGAEGESGVAAVVPLRAVV